jgi:hypothetical protein
MGAVPLPRLNTRTSELTGRITVTLFACSIVDGSFAPTPASPDVAAPALAVSQITCGMIAGHTPTLAEIPAPERTPMTDGEAVRR